ncbi:hypothetical protein BOTCAL_0586g00030 [Botryotinia calthae]|uniref:Zn(2)-C6 fungal-type domain-containing protein n=1 Tax=Botryotinia calthae TaxID=38488 RepID=A0A4Y8CK06_9HELO|nr:hypothetical protein BOTCAL_0586g00030 [Botryotinia calthae]
MIILSTASDSQENSELPCRSCRQRKLKCSRAKPKCDTCARLQRRCEYPECKGRLDRKSQYTREKDAEPVASVVPDKQENTPSIPATVTSSGDLDLESSFEFNPDLPVLLQRQN